MLPNPRYDVDNSGAIDKKEMTKVMKSIYSMLSSSSVSRESSEEEATAHAAKLFREVDVNGDGELSQEEFIEGRRNIIFIINAMSIFFFLFVYISNPEYEVSPVEGCKKDQELMQKLKQLVDQCMEK